jgi:hypothetical protein
MSIEDVFGHFRWCWKKIVGGVYRGVRQTRIGLLAGAVGVGVGESFGLASLVPSSACAESSRRRPGAVLVVSYNLPAPRREMVLTTLDFVYIS